MYQCLGLGTVESGGCGEDWWHPECLLGLPRVSQRSEERSNNTASESREMLSNASDIVAREFPAEEEFESLICHKCVGSNPWIKPYARSDSFIFRPRRDSAALTDSADNKVAKKITVTAGPSSPDPRSRKRKASEEEDNDKHEMSDHSLAEPAAKRSKNEADHKHDETLSPANSFSGSNVEQDNTSADNVSKTAQRDNVPSKPDGERGQSEKDETAGKPLHELLAAHSPPASPFSLFLKPDFRSAFCRCKACYPTLVAFPQLLEEEELYQPPRSEGAPSESGSEDEDEDVAGQSGGEAENNITTATTSATALPTAAAAAATTTSPPPLLTSMTPDTAPTSSAINSTLLNRGEAALNSMDRVRAIEGVLAYNELRDKVKTFLKPYAESGTIVGEDDVRGYFEELRREREEKGT